MKGKMLFLLVIALALLLLFVAVGEATTTMIITTVAGGGVGDSGPATNAPIPYPVGVAVDSNGNLYIVDSWSNRIRKVDTSGIITTVAGNGNVDYSGDGGLATNASLWGPEHTAVDASGNLYIADSANHRIRKVDTSGIITTVAGNGILGYSGDGGPATSASLGYLAGVQVDAGGNLYIADTSYHRIRKVDTSGIITTVAGNGTWGYSGDGGLATNASLWGPHGVAVDTGGNLYIADLVNHRIRKVDTSGIITTVAGNGTYGYSGDGGPATNASLWWPSGIAVDANGSLYIADIGNHRIRKVDTSGIITTVAGNGNSVYSGDGGPATNASLRDPADVAVDASGNLYIADRDNQRIRKVDTLGIITTMAGNGTYGYSGDGGPATSASLWLPPDVAVDASGNLYIADSDSQRIRKVDTSGIITTVAGNGTRGYGGDGGPATNASLRYPEGVALDANGNLYIADTRNERIRKVDTWGIITTVAGNGTRGCSGDGGPATNASLRWPWGVALDANGNLYIADMDNHRIRKVDTSGIITTVAGNGTYGYSGDGGPATNTSLWGPYGVAVDASGNLYIADQGNYRIRKVDTWGIITTVAGNGTYGYSGDGGPATNASLWLPSDVAVDTSGNLYIADYGNHRIRKVDTSGIITTLAGNGTASYSGDGGPATSASLQHPWGVALDANSNLYIADWGNHRIRKVSLANTTIGDDITVSPISEVTVTFATVTGAGNTTATVSNTPPGGTSTGFRFLGQYYDITTTASYAGPITVSLTYNDAAVPSGKENKLKIMHWDGVRWVDCTVSLDTVNNVITGVVSSLSPFAVAAAPTFDWRPPISVGHKFNAGSTVPIKFTLHDALGAFVADTSVQVTVSGNGGSVTFGYGTSNGYVNINSLDEEYHVNLHLRNYAWIVPGPTYAIRVTFAQTQGYVFGETTFSVVRGR